MKDAGVYSYPTSRFPNPTIVFFFRLANSFQVSLILTPPPRPFQNRSYVTAMTAIFVNKRFYEHE